jgi:SAM-dependent methyltransferase
LDLLRYYATNDEGSRHLRQQLEFEVTKRFLQDWISSNTPATILEVGAGSGYYTRWLLEKGHSVYSIEPTPELVILLNHIKTQFPDRLHVIHGDDRTVHDLNERFDRILLMGPLYHLFTFSERVDLLKAAKTKLKPDGEIFSVFLSRVGFMSYLIKNQPDLLPNNPETIAHVIQNGFDPNVKPNGDFRGHFDSLQSVIELHQASGLNVLRFLSLDPLIGPHDEHFNQLSDEAKPFWIEVAYHLSSWPEVLGSSRTWGFVSK